MLGTSEIVSWVVYKMTLHGKQVGDKRGVRTGRVGCDGVSASRLSHSSFKRALLVKMKRKGWREANKPLGSNRDSPLTMCATQPHAD